MASPGAATPSESTPSAPRRPTEGLYNTQSTTDATAANELTGAGKKRRSHRGGKKKKSRRQSFLPTLAPQNGGPSSQNPDEAVQSTTARPPFYRMNRSGGRNLSETSLDSNALLDHRYDCHY